MPDKRNAGKKKGIFIQIYDWYLWYLAGSVSTLNTIRRDRQYMPGQSASSIPDFDPFSLKNSTKEFRLRCDKVCYYILIEIEIFLI